MTLYKKLIGILMLILIGVVIYYPLSGSLFKKTDTEKQIVKLMSMDKE